METDRLKKDSTPRTPCFLKNIHIISRTCGLLTIIMVWIAAVVVIKNNHGETYVGWYLVAVGILVVLLELIWIIILSDCCNPTGCCCRCFLILGWLDNWKKGILYILISIPVFMASMRIILGIVSGFFLIVLGMLYILKTFQSSVIYTREETRYVQTSTPSVRVIVHEVSTQTADDNYYQEIADAQKTTKNPFE